MNLSINANGFSNVQNTAAGHKAEQANKQGKSAFFAGSPVLTTKNQIEQRKKMAQKSALKLVKDAWDNDQAVEKTVASQRQRYAELDAQRTEAKKALAGYEDQEKTLKEQCNVADDSKEQQDLNLLEKRQEYRRGSLTILRNNVTTTNETAGTSTACGSNVSLLSSSEIR